MYLREGNVNLRGFAYFDDCDHLIGENGHDKYLKTPSGEPRKCKLLMASLAPSALKQAVLNAVSFEHTQMKKSVLEHVAAQKNMLSVNVLKNHRWNSAINDYELLVNWKSFQLIEDSCGPFKKLANEIKTVVAAYVRQHG